MLNKKVVIKFSENVLAGIYGYALVLRNNLVRVSSDGQRQCDLVWMIFTFFITSLFSLIVKLVSFSNASL